MGNQYGNYLAHRSDLTMRIPDDGRMQNDISYGGQNIQVMMTVAIETPGVGDWAVYRAPMSHAQMIWPWDRGEDADLPVSLAHAINECLKRGDKVGRDEAEALFPTMAERLEYRS